MTGPTAIRELCTAPGCDDEADCELVLLDPVPVGFPERTVVCRFHLPVLLGALDAWEHPRYRVTSWW